MSALPPGARRAYVGSRTTRERHARGDGISQCIVHADGSLVLEQVYDGLVNPSFLAINRAGTRLHTVHGDGDAVSSFAIAPQDGSLRLLHQQRCGGLNPVHLALDPAERHLLVSDHLGEGRTGGGVIVLPLDADGLPGTPTQRVPMVGTPGPHRVEQPCAKPHFNPFDPSGRFVLVPDKGLDRVFVHRFADGRLSDTPDATLRCREGSGPRHLAFGADGRTLYVLHELDSTVSACHFDPDHGSLRAFQVLSSLPDDFTGDSRAAGIVVSADGRTLYASNRGSDTIAVFAIEAGSGRLSWRRALPCGGRTPRFFTPTPDGRWLLVLNEDDDQIVSFPLAADGQPGAAAFRQACGSPVCLVFAP